MSEAMIPLAKAAVLRRSPSVFAVARQQLRLIDATKRFPLLVAVLAGVAAFSLSPGPAPVPEGLFPFFSILLATIAWPILVWAGEAPARRGYHRILPVHHVTHDLLKVFAGACWLMLGVAIVLATVLVVALVSGFADVIYGLSMTVFVSYFTAPLIVYLFLSVIPILTNKPIEWLLGIVVALAVIDAIGNAYPITWSLTDRPGRLWALWYLIAELPGDLLGGAYGLGIALVGGYVYQPWDFLFGLSDRAGRSEVAAGQWGIATALWICAGITAVYWASIIANRRDNR